VDKAARLIETWKFVESDVFITGREGSVDHRLIAKGVEHMKNRNDAGKFVGESGGPRCY